MSEMWLCILLLLNLCNIPGSPSTINSLPGFLSNLPFKLETGYVGIGASDDVQLFYYFIESERNPSDDPLILWFNGGPGCSGFSGLVYQIGPVGFDYENSSWQLPSFVLNQYSWTKIANIIFLDAPVGAGFSYAKSWEGYHTTDTFSAAQTHDFIRKWLINHPKFLKNSLYVGSDSYSGIVVPVIVQDILAGNEIGHNPSINLKGYLLGNPLTDYHIDLSSRIPYAHRLSLISDEIYESTKRTCDGEYINVDPDNAACLDDLKIVRECVDNLNREHILEPQCDEFSRSSTTIEWDQCTLGQNPTDSFLSQPQLPRWECRRHNYLLSYLWANSKAVQTALRVQEGTINEWVRCNRSLTSTTYTSDISSSIDYHRNLTDRGIRALIHSGDHDMVIPYVGTLKWIKSLNLNISSRWRPWFVDEQVAGYTVEYANSRYKLTFVTVKGAGHTTQEYKPKETLAMVDRWFAHLPL